MNRWKCIGRRGSKLMDASSNMQKPANLVGQSDSDGAGEEAGPYRLPWIWVD
jgi:hypothetical protein